MKKIEITSQAKDISSEIKKEQKKISTKQIREILIESATSNEGIKDIIKYIDAGNEVSCIKIEHMASAKMLSNQLTLKGTPFAIIRFSKKNELLFILKSVDTDIVKTLLYNIQILMSVITNAPNKEYEKLLSQYIIEGGILTQINIAYGVSNKTFETNLQHYRIPYAVFSNKALNAHTYVIRECDQQVVNMIHNQLAKRLTSN